MNDEISGIYKIVSTRDGKYYIGSSKDINRRFKRHLNDLKLNKHNNTYLQRYFNKYGQENLILLIIEQVPTCQLFNREQYYLDSMKKELCFNIGRKASGGDNITLNPNREDIKKKQAEATLRNWNKKTEEQKREYSIKLSGEFNPNFGKRWSLEKREQMSKRVKEYFLEKDNYRKGKKFEQLWSKDKAEILKKALSDSAKKKVGKLNPFFGKSHSEKTKEKIREKNKGVYKGKQELEVLVNGNIYKSVSEAARVLNVCPATVIYRIKSKSKKFDGYFYKKEVAI